MNYIPTYEDYYQEWQRDFFDDMRRHPTEEECEYFKQKFLILENVLQETNNE